MTKQATRETFSTVADDISEFDLLMAIMEQAFGPFVPVFTNYDPEDMPGHN